MTTQGLAVSDFKGLHDLKQLALKDSDKALPEVARQFESIFLQTMLKSMREGGSFLDEDSPFKSKAMEQYQDMLDGQYATELTKGRGIGLAEMLTRQLEQGKPKGDAKDHVLDMQRLQQTVTAKPIPQTPPAPKESSSIGQFVNTLLPMAKKAASLLGLDPKMLIAQAALETGWGQFISKDENGNSSNNLFNIKALGKQTDDAVKVKTTEYIADTPIKTTASFRKYDNMQQSFNDYVALIKGSERYQGALAQADNPEGFINALHRAGYATDPNYSDKVMAIYDSRELKQALEQAGL